MTKSRGYLEYKIHYNASNQKLHVTVVSCSDLMETDLTGKSDPFVRVFLLPGTHKELKTRVVKGNLNPTFNDEFSFVLSPIDVRKKTIVFQVFDKDTFGADGIGEVQVPLWEIPSLEAGVEHNLELGSITKDKNKKPILAQKRPSDTGSISSETSMYEAEGTSHHSYAQSSTTTYSSSTHSSSHVRGGVGAGFNSGRPSFNDGSGRPNVGGGEPPVPVHQAGLTLHELNNKLERYIQQIQLKPDDPIVKISVTSSSSGGSFDVHEMPEFREYENLFMEFMEQEEQIARVEAEITILQHDNDDFQKRLSSIQMKIDEKRSEISRLEAQIREYEIKRQSDDATLTDTMIFNAGVNAKKEKQGFIDRLKTLRWETITTTEEMENEEQIRQEIKMMYDKRLDEEIEKIRLLYSSYESEMRVSIKGIFDAKITELKKLRQDWSDREIAEVDSILARLEHAKKQIVDMEMKKLELSHEERRLNDQYEEDELRYKSMLLAKQTELKELKEQYYSLEVEYKRIEIDNSGYLREVERYGRIITGNHPQRVTEHAKQFYGLRNPDDSDLTSSSDEEGNDGYQRKKKQAHGSKRQSKTTTYTAGGYTGGVGGQATYSSSSASYGGGVIGGTTSYSSSSTTYGGTTEGFTGGMTGGMIGGMTGGMTGGQTSYSSSSTTYGGTTGGFTSGITGGATEHTYVQQSYTRSNH